jgi:hypothetical protein
MGTARCKDLKTGSLLHRFDNKRLTGQVGGQPICFVPEMEKPGCVGNRAFLSLSSL